MTQDTRTAAPDPVAAEAAPATVGSLLRDAAAALRGRSETPRLDAELLLADVLGCERERLIIDSADTIGPGTVDAMRSRVARRAAHEPVAYLTGRRGFRWLELGVDERVLIPRPESELLVELALTLPPGARVLDVGTGSGAIALAIRHERPDLAVSAVDCSEDALAVARANARRLGLEVTFACSNLLAAVGDRFDAIVANLPYIADQAALVADVDDYEPQLALRSGADGLDAIRGLVTQLEARARADRPGLLALEIGSDQGERVAALVRGLDYPQVEVIADLAGLDRVVCGRMSR